MNPRVLRNIQGILFFSHIYERGNKQLLFNNSLAIIKLNYFKKFSSKHFSYGFAKRASPVTSEFISIKFLHTHSPRFCPTSSGKRKKLFPRSLSVTF